MAEEHFWGQKGEYGPFPAQEDGWPRAGAVVRYYRTKKGMGAETLAKYYSEVTKTHVTSRWIYKMEQQNKIPNDITRRQALVKILEIPPMLLGLAALEQTLPQQKQTPSVAFSAEAPILKQHPATDLTSYETTIRAVWLLNETSHAHHALNTVLVAIQQLEALEKQSEGNLQCHVRALLYSHYRLVCRVYRDMMELPSAYHYANLAVRVTKRLQNNDLLATALHTRGFVCLVWGLHGEKTPLGLIEPHREKLTNALRDFEQAFPLARPQVKGLLYLDISRTQAALQQSQVEKVLAVKTMDLAETFVGKGESSTDPYTNILFDGRAKGLNEEEYLVNRATIFNTLGSPGKAIEAMETIERLGEQKRRSKDHTRHYAWLEVVQAKAYCGIKEYSIASQKAQIALDILSDIDCLNNIAHIQAIYNDLLLGSAHNHPEVKKLGKMLERYYHRRRINV